MKKIFSQRLQGLRSQKSLTLSQLAERVNLVKQTVGNFEKGRILPSVPVLAKLADEFGCSTDYLLGREAPEPPPQWLGDLIPYLASLDQHGQEAVKALVKGLQKR
jgi:transcriptional regulator with XRE-family HTH domain